MTVLKSEYLDYGAKQNEEKMSENRAIFYNPAVGIRKLVVKIEWDLRDDEGNDNDNDDDERRGYLSDWKKKRQIKIIITYLWAV